MAERTHTFCRAHGDSIEVSYVYDDQTGDLLRLIVRNDHPTLTVEAGVDSTTTGYHREGSWGPQSGVTTVNIPPGQRPTLDLVPDGRPPGGGEPDYYPTVSGLDYWMRLV